MASRAQCSVRTGQVGTAAFTVGASSTEHFSHFYETCVGSGHMSLTLREDWRTHIRMAAKDLGVKHIRGHGLLDDDMSVSYAYGKHAFYNIDSLVDVLMSVGARRTHARIEHTHPLALLPSCLRSVCRRCLRPCLLLLPLSSLHSV